MKKLISVLLTASLALGLAACGAPAPSSTAAGSTSGTEEPASGEEKVIRIAWWGSQLRNDITTQAIELYESQNPGVKFEIEFADYAGYWDKIAVQAASGTMPDIIQNVYENLETHKSKDMLVDLKPYMESGVLDMSNVDESIWSSAELDGGLYGVVLGVNVPCFLYDVAVVEEAGVTIKDGMTWTEFMDAAKAIYEKTGKVTCMPMSDDLGLSMWLRGQGYHYFDASGDKLGYPDPSATEGYYELFQTGIQEGYIIDPRVWVERDYDTLDQRPLVDGTAWNDFGLSNCRSEVELCGREIGLAQWPVNETDVVPAGYMRPATYFSVTTSTKYPEECAKFLSWFTNSIECNEILKGERGVPIAEPVIEKLSSEADEIDKMMYDYVAAAPEYCSPISPASPEGVAEIKVLMNQILEQVQYMQLTPKEASEQFFTQANEILAKQAS